MIVHLEDRAVLHVDGAEARAFLQGLLTNDLGALAPGRPLWAGLLSAQGKALFDIILFDDGAGGVWIDCEGTRADELARRLTMYRLKRAVRIEHTGRAVMAAWDGDGQPGWATDPRLAALGCRGVGEAGVPAGAAAYRPHRLALGVPEGAEELGIDKTLWLEANAAELNGVSFTKGCYVGQENTARMHYRANVRRRLLPVVLSGAAGEERAIMAGERVAGELRAWNDARGIAWLRLADADSPLTLAGAPLCVDWPVWLPRAETGLEGED